MTTIVTVAAHVSEVQQVCVKITQNGIVVEALSLQNGEQANYYVHEGRELSVMEIPKEQSCNG